MEVRRMNSINWDKLAEKNDEQNPEYRRRFMDEDGYHGTGLTKQEWEERKADDEEN